MKNLIDLEKKINSELTTKIKSTKIKHKQIYISIEISLVRLFHNDHRRLENHKKITIHVFEMLCVLASRLLFHQHYDNLDYMK